MPGTVIGISLNMGYPGEISREDPGMMIVGGPVHSSTPIAFGAPVRLNQSTNDYDQMNSLTDTYSILAGIALREVKQAASFLAQNVNGQYNQYDNVDILAKGYCTVQCQSTTAPTAGAAVYAIFNTASGIFQFFDNVTGSGGNTGIALTNCKFKSSNMDANNVCEIEILTPNQG